MTIINHKYKFIFVKTRKTAGTSLEIALSKFCNKNDLVTSIKSNDEKLRQDMNFQGPTNNCYIKYFINFKAIFEIFKDLVKVLPFSKKIFNYKTNPRFDFNFPFIASWEKYTEHNYFLDLKKKIDSKVFDNYLKFTLVRHPYDLMISHFWWQVKKKEFSIKSGFNNFVKNESKLFFKSHSKILNIENLSFDRIIKFENLKDDLIELSNSLKLPENLHDVFKDIKTKNTQRVDKSLDLLYRESKEIIYHDWKKYFNAFGYQK